MEGGTLIDISHHQTAAPDSKWVGVLVILVKTYFEPGNYRIFQILQFSHSGMLRTNQIALSPTFQILNRFFYIIESASNHNSRLTNQFSSFYSVARLLAKLYSFTCNLEILNSPTFQKQF